MPEAAYGLFLCGAGVGGLGGALAAAGRVGAAQRVVGLVTAPVGATLAGLAGHTYGMPPVAWGGRLGVLGGRRRRLADPAGNRPRLPPLIGGHPAGRPLAWSPEGAGRTRGPTGPWPSRTVRAGGTVVDDGTKERPLVLAGILLGGAGVFDVLAGVGDLIGDPYVSIEGGGMYHYDITGWAWLHLAAGALLAVAGALVPLGRRWSTRLALLAVVVAVATHLLMLTYHPIRAVIVLGLALTAARLVLRQRRSRTA